MNWYKIAQSKIRTRLPSVLYHATFEPYIESIKQYGLGGKTSPKNYEDSKEGVVYLAIDPDMAESFAETTDIAPEEYLDQIVILEVDTSQLDKTKLFKDMNYFVMNTVTNPVSFEYHSVIPPSALRIIK